MGVSQMLLVAVAGLAAVPIEVQRLDETSLSGTFVSLSADELVLDVSGEQQKLPVRDLLTVTTAATDPQTDVGSKIVVELIDGSRLVATGYAVQGAEATIGLAGETELKVGTRLIRSVLLQRNELDPALEKQWNGILAEKAAGDVIVIRRTTKPKIDDPDAPAKPMVSLDFLPGVFFDVTDKVVQFEFDGTRIDVGRPKVQGLIYYHAAGEALPEAVCRVTDQNGSQWNARSVQVSQGKLQVVTTSGAKVDLALEHLGKLDYTAGKIVYLSELTPDSRDWEPYIASRSSALLARLLGPRTDATIDGPLSLGGKVYHRGLSLRSGSRVVWRVPSGFRKLLATVGIDDSVRPGGDVRLVFMGDGKSLLDRPIRGSDKPLQLELDIEGIRQLTLLVEYGGTAHLQDNLDLANARITK